MKVLIIIGSASDEKYAIKCAEILLLLEVPFRATVASAHRSPQRVAQLINSLAVEYGVIIAMAGHAAHLAGVIASKTILPVIGVPLPSSELNGMDSLLSTVQMPGGIPVACTGIGESGAHNAAVLACEMLSLGDPTLRQRIQKYRDSLATKIEAAASEFESKWKK